MANDEQSVRSVTITLVGDGWVSTSWIREVLLPALEAAVTRNSDRE